MIEDPPILKNNPILKKVAKSLIFFVCPDENNNIERTISKTT